MSLRIKSIAAVALTALAITYLALVPLHARSDIDQTLDESDTVLDPSRPLEAPSVKEITAMVTGYNTVASQTDDTPCIAAGGNICGRTDTVACPQNIPLHSWVQIQGKRYECMDRTASKFNGRFDISCDKDMKCPAIVTGKKKVLIL